MSRCTHTVSSPFSPAYNTIGGLQLTTARLYRLAVDSMQFVPSRPSPASALSLYRDYIYLGYISAISPASALSL